MGISDLQTLKDMSWREFQLRRLGYLRKEKSEWIHSRFLAYYSLAATGAIETKKMTIEQFMPLDGKKRGRVSSGAIEMLKKEQQKYEDQINGSRT